MGGEDNDQNFYFKGHSFKTQKEMFEYVKKWNEQNLNLENTLDGLDKLIANIGVNLHVRDFPFNNQEFLSYLEEIFKFSMILLNKKEQQHDKENGSEDKRQ